MAYVDVVDPMMEIEMEIEYIDSAIDELKMEEMSGGRRRRMRKIPRIIRALVKRRKALDALFFTGAAGLVVGNDNTGGV